MDNAGDQPPFNGPEKDLRAYASLAILPLMPLDPAAPPPMPPGHKSHLNHLHVQPERYRKRLCYLISCRDVPGYNRLIKRFVQRLPAAPLAVPAQDPRTGACFTIPVHGLRLNIATPFLPHLTTINEIIPWMYAYPFPTLTRIMQVAFPEAASWDLTPLPASDMDVHIWLTFVWRKSPRKSDVETFYNSTIPKQKPKHSLIICMQPQWVLTEADINSFKNVECFPLYSERDDNPAYTSAYRIWAKLWDLCVRADCRFWVLTTYQRWIFGSFSKGFQAGHIFSIKSFDCKNPTVMETLIFHTAKSMGLANDLYLGEYPESTDDNGGPPEPPRPHSYPGMEFSDSESEWEGVDDVPGPSSGASEYLDAQVSAYGSEAHVELPVVRVFRVIQDDIPNQRQPSPIRARVRRNRHTRSVSYIAGHPTDFEAEVNHGTMNGGLHDEDDSDVQFDDVQTDPAPRPIRRRYVGVSRATTEVTDSVVSWADNVETDLDAVEDLLQINEINDVNPNAITHTLGNMEAVYLSAMETWNPNGGPSLSVPRPPQQMIHSRQLHGTGGYLTAIPEVGSSRKAEQEEEAREEDRRENEREAHWADIQRKGVVYDWNGAEYAFTFIAGSDRQPPGAA